MITVNGIEEARLLLTRRAGVAPESLPPRVQDRITAIFGQPLTAQEVVSRIVREVREKGDEALLYYAAVIDGVKLKDLRVSAGEVKAAYRSVSSERRRGAQGERPRARRHLCPWRHCRLSFISTYDRRTGAGRRCAGDHHDHPGAGRRDGPAGDAGRR